MTEESIMKDEELREELAKIARQIARVQQGLGTEEEDGIARAELAVTERVIRRRLELLESGDWPGRKVSPYPVGAEG